MTLIFEQYRAANNKEVLITLNRQGTYLPDISIAKHDESKEINSIKIEIIDNKPFYIPLGKTDQMYKCQFKTFNIIDFNVFYTIIGNDVLKVIESNYPEFPEDTFWSVESITSRELPGSSYAIMSNNAYIPAGTQTIIMEYELELSKSETDVLGRPRE